MKPYEKFRSLFLAAHPDATDRMINRSFFSKKKFKSKEQIEKENLDEPERWRIEDDFKKKNLV